MSPLNIVNNPTNQQFQVFLEDEMAFLEYRLSDNMIVLMHTEVPEKLGARGIATALAAFAFDYARTHNLKVKIYCPFILTWIKRHPEQMDIVVPPSQGKSYEL